MKPTRIVLPAILALLVVSTTAMAGETKGPVTDEIGVVVIPKGDPIQIGGIWAQSGDAASIGEDQQRGVELYFDKIGQVVAGHKIKLIVEDGQCTAEGGQSAGTRLAANPDIVAVLGPECSSTAIASAPILWNVGMPMVATGASSPTLTAPDRDQGLQAFVRTYFNDNAQGLADADYLYKVVGCKTLATIHDGSDYSTNLARLVETRFKELGGTILASEAVEATAVDMHPVLTSIAAAKPCALFYSTFIAASAQFIRQAKDVKGLESVPQFGGGSLLSAGYLKAAGDAAVGVKLLIADTSPTAYSKDYPALVTAYKAKYGEDPISAFHAQAYDGAHLLELALAAVAKTDTDGNTYIGRKALRDALFHAAPFDGLSGTIQCDSNGDCGKFAFAAYEFTSGDEATFAVGKNPKKIYPAN